MTYLMNTVHEKPVEVRPTQAEGSWVDGKLDAYDSEERKAKTFIDLYADCGTHSLGYNSRETRAVLRSMLLNNTPVHVSNSFRFEQRERAARRLCQASRMDKVFFANSGAEAVETAIKLVRRYSWKKRESKQIVYAVPGMFHGRTLATLACCYDGPSYYYDGFGPLPGGFESFERLRDIDPDNAAGILLCPIATPTDDMSLLRLEWLREIRAYANRYEIPIIFDEIQTGSGRTGAYLYAHQLGIMPDVVCLAKGLGMGASVSATLARGEIAETFEPGSHFSTFGGNGIAVSFVNGMLDWLGYSDEIVPNCKMPKGEEILKKSYRLTVSLENFDGVTNIRGAGLMQAFDIDVSLPEFADRCRGKGLLVPAFRSGLGTVKVYPPFNMPNDVISDAVRIMKDVRKEMKK